MSQRKTVVLVDDDEMVREVAARMLRRGGFDVAEFDTGADALAAIISSRPDIIITDYRMPGMTGGELLHAVHQRLNGSTPPALIVSGLPCEAHATCQELPHIVRQIVPKPFTLQQLTTAVQIALALQ